MLPQAVWYHQVPVLAKILDNIRGSSILPDVLPLLHQDALQGFLAIIATGLHVTLFDPTILADKPSNSNAEG